MTPESDRLANLAQEWRVSLEERFETESSFIAYGQHHGQPVVLKVLKQQGDEWRSGEVLDAFCGNGMVRVHEHVPGAVLLERLRPGNSLVGIAVGGRDEEATDVLAHVIQQMSAGEPPTACPTLWDWAKGFERYYSGGDRQIPRDLLEKGYRVYSELCSSQRTPRLLHGDLHHYNVLFDSDRGWLAIDPKGVVGEVEYEIGAVLRNPIEEPGLFASPARVDARLKQFASRLNLSRERMLAWSFAQAILSAIWGIEDGFTVDATTPSIRLANVIRAMLPIGADA